MVDVQEQKGSSARRDQRNSLKRHGCSRAGLIQADQLEVGFTRVLAVRASVGSVHMAWWDSEKRCGLDFLRR